MQYEEAAKAICGLNDRGWAFSMTQSLGRVVFREFSGSFTHYKGTSTPMLSAQTFTDLVTILSEVVEAIEARWLAQKR